jgi:hypothetical protein
MIFNEEHVQGNQMFEIGLNSVSFENRNRVFLTILERIQCGSLQTI